MQNDVPLNPLARLERLVALTDRFSAELADAIERGGQKDDPPAIAFQRVFKFAGDTLRTVILALSKHRDVLSALTLVRPIFEISARIFWAARTPDGWERFQASYASAEKEWADDAKKHDLYRPFATRISSLADQVLDRTDAKGQRYKRMPDLRQVLAHNESQDNANGDIAAAAAGHADFQYTNIYRMLCRPAHGNIFPMVDEGSSPDLRHVIVGAGVSVWTLIRAVCHIGAADPKGEMEWAGRQIIDLIGGCEDLTIDDLSSVAEQQ